MNSLAPNQLVKTLLLLSEVPIFLEINLPKDEKKLFNCKHFDQSFNLMTGICDYSEALNKTGATLINNYVKNINLNSKGEKKNNIFSKCDWQGKKRIKHEGMKTGHLSWSRNHIWILMRINERLWFFSIFKAYVISRM